MINRKTAIDDEILVRMDLSVNEIEDQYPNLNQENVSNKDILAITKAIVDELKTIFEDQVIQRSGELKFELIFIISNLSIYLQQI